MAYSDYGGYAYKNGERVEERSDYTIRPDGSGVGTPGAYPGFAMAAAGANAEQIKQFVSYPHHHVVLGDGPILVGLYKQSCTSIYRNGKELEGTDFLIPECAEAISSYEYEGKTVRYVSSDWSISNDKPVIFEVDGVRIEAQYVVTDNYYQLVKVTQPDGSVWTGFSGYGVGAGLEDAGYGYSTDDIEALLFETFSGQIISTTTQEKK